eukprot:4862988-Amphidinium_carterae.1
MVMTKLKCGGLGGFCGLHSEERKTGNSTRMDTWRDAKNGKTFWAVERIGKQKPISNWAARNLCRQRSSSFFLAREAFFGQSEACLGKRTPFPKNRDMVVCGLFIDSECHPLWFKPWISFALLLEHGSPVAFGNGSPLAWPMRSGWS